MKFKEIIPLKIRVFIRPFISAFISSKLFDKTRLKKWKKEGCPVPPPHIVKQLAIREYQQKTGYNILVETGTYTGAMVEAQKNFFKKIVSIELCVELFQKAQHRFRKDKNVEIMQGDSGKVLAKALEHIDEPILFWLDGHYSSGITAKGEKNCPILEEIDAIFKIDSFEHVLLIDDARMFVGKDDYPTIEDLGTYLRNINNSYVIDVKDDIIRCTVN